MIEKALEYEAKDVVGIIRVCRALYPMLSENARVVNVSSRLGMLRQMASKEVRAKLSDQYSTLTEQDIAQVMRDYVE